MSLNIIDLVLERYNNHGYSAILKRSVESKIKFRIYAKELKIKLFIDKKKSMAKWKVFKKQKGNKPNEFDLNSKNFGYAYTKDLINSKKIIFRVSHYVSLTDDDYTSTSLDGYLREILKHFA